MVAWAALLPVAKAALPYIGKAAAGLAGSSIGNKLGGGIFSGGDDSPEGSGTPYNAQVEAGMVPINQNTGLFSKITGIQEPQNQSRFYDRLINRGYNG